MKTEKSLPLISPDTDLKGVKMLAAKIRTEVEGHNFEKSFEEDYRKLWNNCFWRE